MTTHLADELADVLGSVGLAELDRAQEWCQEWGVEQLSDIMQARAEEDFVEFLALTPTSQKSLLGALRRHGRVAPPGLLEKPFDSTALTPTASTRLLSLSALKRRVTHGGNRKVIPSKWALTVGQFNDFMTKCSSEEKVKWHELAAADPKKGTVSGYQVCEHFVKPFTFGTGCSVALLLNPEKPLDAAVMISHTWAEDMLEVQEAINDRARADGAGDDLPIWFCLYSNYQPGAEDNVGPTIEQQLKMDPFGTVISSTTLRYMCLIVTSQQDPYERLWCVYELHCALQNQVSVEVEFSRCAANKYRDEMLTWSQKEATDAKLTHTQWVYAQNKQLGPEYAYYRKEVDCKQATCGFAKDAAWIRKQIEDGDGWDQLNDEMAKFRRPLTCFVQSGRGGA